MESAALLVRVSTKEQEDNSSPEAQIKREREYCRMKGYAIVAERIETMSGAFVLARSVYNEYLNMAADGKVNVIVADIPDRLGRGDAIAKLELLAQLNGARVEYAQPGRDTSTVEGLIQHSAEQMVSGIERLNIKRRTFGGKMDWARRGRVIASVYRPYGLQFVKAFDGRGRKISCTLEIVPDEAEAVRLMYEWCVYECLTTYAIAKRLTEMGIPTKSMKDHTTRRNPKELWHRNTVYRMLTSRTYAGKWQYCKHEYKREDTSEGIKVRSRTREEKDRISVSVPAIVSEDLWQAAQEQLKANTVKFIRPAKHQYLLRGRITCAVCNRHMCGHYWHPPKKQELRYYACAYTPVASMSGERCPASRLRADVIEDVTWEAICEAWHDEKRLFEGVAKRRDISAAARCRIETLITVEVDGIEQAQTECARWDKAYGTGAISVEELTTHRKERDSKIAKHQTEIKNLNQRLAENPQILPEFETELHRIRAEIADRLTPDTPYEGRQRLIEMLDVRVDWDSMTSQAHISGLIGERVVHLTS